MRYEVLVVGIGQSLCGDDAAGLQAVRLWKAAFPETASMSGVHVETLELPGLALLDHLLGARAAVLVDAVHDDRPPGSIRLLGLDDVISFTCEAKSAHGWGVAETLKLGLSIHPRLQECRLVLVGISGTNFAPGSRIEAKVEEALTTAADTIQHQVLRLLAE